jgi:hypothetical protein
MMTNQILTRPHICLLYDGTSKGNSQHRHDRGASRVQWNGYQALLIKSEGAERGKTPASDPKRTSLFQRVTETQYDALS